MRRAGRTPDRFFFRGRLLAKIIIGTWLATSLIALVILFSAVIRRKEELEHHVTSVFQLVRPLAEVLILRPKRPETADDKTKERLSKLVRLAQGEGSGHGYGLALTGLQVDVYTDHGLYLSTDLSLTSGAKTPDWVRPAIQGEADVTGAELSDWFSQACYIRDKTRRPGAIVVRLPRAIISENVRNYALRMLAAIVAIVLCMDFAVLLFLYVAVLRPVRRIVDANRALARGKFGESRIPRAEIPADELGNIMATHNLMLTHLDKLLSRLRSAKLDAEESRAKLHQNYLVLESIKNDLEDKNVRLQELDRLKSAFLANVSHELRTPLTSIIGFTDLTLRSAGASLQEAARGNLERVKTNAAVLLQMINDLLDLSKIESGKMTLVLEPVDLGAVAREAVQSVEPLAREKGISLSTKVEGDPDRVRIRTDRLKVGQILLNLLGNAVKFTDQGCVDVIVRPVDSGLEIVVKDTGIGISPSDIPLIFDAFHQVDASPTRRHGGTGLGLSIVKKLAELLGGDTRVESAVGRGSTFTVRLPRELEAGGSMVGG